MGVREIDGTERQLLTALDAEFLITHIPAPEERQIEVEMVEHEERHELAHNDL